MKVKLNGLLGKPVGAWLCILLVCLMTLSTGVKSQVRTGKITGTVTDKVGKESLIGVSIQVKNLNKFYQTNASGSFEIDLPAGTYELVFNYIGFESKSIPALVVKGGERTLVNIEMSISTSQLNEVVVVGYGTQQKRDLTGSVANIESELLEKRYTNNALAALSGLAPGVTVLNNSGSPEGDYKVIIRGLGSITASNDPLYVIDGVIDADPQLINPADMRVSMS
ncbi:MAG: carboxypeptidase-like regulatory domain-containing protein [Bacteroidota bacterium]